LSLKVSPKMSEVCALISSALGIGTSAKVSSFVGGAACASACVTCLKEVPSKLALAWVLSA